MKNILLILLFLNFCSLEIYSQDCKDEIRYNQIRNYFLKKGMPYYVMNDNPKPRIIIIDSLKRSDFKSDTLIFVQKIGSDGSQYCTYYNSLKNCITSFYVTARPLQLEPESNNDLTIYIINNIKKGNIDGILEAGKDDTYQHSTSGPIHIVITIAIAKDEGEIYNITSYMINPFDVPITSKL